MHRKASGHQETGERVFMKYWRRLEMGLIAFLLNSSISKHCSGGEPVEPTSSCKPFVRLLQVMDRWCSQLASAVLYSASSTLWSGRVFSVVRMHLIQALLWGRCDMFWRTTFFINMMQVICGNSYSKKEKSDILITPWPQRSIFFGFIRTNRIGLYTTRHYTALASSQRTITYREIWKHKQCFAKLMQEMQFFFLLLFVVVKHLSVKRR